MTPPPASDAKPRRFYSAVEVAAADVGFEVTLDGRAVRTPAGIRLGLPTARLAELVAEEWAAQSEVVDLARMPATRLAYTGQDLGPRARDKLADEAASYAGSDLLCYIADGPATLAAEQRDRWGPWLDWAGRELGLVLVATHGVMHARQPAGTTDRARALAQALGDFALTGLAFATALYGSAVLAFALQRRALTGEEAFELSRLDEAHQEQRWGVDAEAAARTAAMRREADLLDRWFAALAAGDTAQGDPTAQGVAG